MKIEQPFKDFFFNYFREWEKLQPKKRSSFSAFARWLTDNSYHTKISQQNVDAWMSGTIPKDHKFIVVLAEKLGKEIYDILGHSSEEILKNTLLQTAIDNWKFLDEHKQAEISRMIAEEAAKYETKASSNGVQKASKRGKTGGD